MISLSSLVFSLRVGSLSLSVSLHGSVMYMVVALLIFWIDIAFSNLIVNRRSTRNNQSFPHQRHNKSSIINTLR